MSSKKSHQKVTAGLKLIIDEHEANYKRIKSIEAHANELAEWLRDLKQFYRQ